MLWGSHQAGLELRTEGRETRLGASFPYGRETVLSDGAQPRKEIIASRAFADRIERGEEIHFLSGHDYNKPLASTRAGTLTLRETDTALEVEAVINGATTWARDFLSAHDAGLIRGLSPGFRVRPGGELVEARGGAILRTIRAADLFEISAVTVPAYPDAQIEARDWQAPKDAPEDWARHAIEMAFGVLPGMFDHASTRPVIREGQRHLAGWTLQPIAALLAEEASNKLGVEVSIDTMRPVQAYDVGGRARALSTIIKAMAEAKEVGIAPGDLNAALTLVNWGEGDKAV